MLRLLPIMLLLTTLTSAQNPERGIVYFSNDNGKTWENRSQGLPDSIFLSDMAVGQGFLGVSTKLHGIFVFDFVQNKWKQTPTMPTETDEVNSLYFFENKLLAGTQSSGIFISDDKGISWTPYNNGLQNFTIRKIFAAGSTLYTGTNSGLYVFDNANRRWKLEFGEDMLQVNGIKELDGEIFIGTNQGAFKKEKRAREWKPLLTNRSLHNISADSKNIYALTYSELLISSDKGDTWRSDQQGLPKDMYSFQIIEKDNTVFAAQWDGVYIRSEPNGWMLTGSGMPAKFPVLELVVYDNILIGASSQWSK